jgi:hypothetical protein
MYFVLVTTSDDTRGLHTVLVLYSPNSKERFTVAI